MSMALVLVVDTLMCLDAMLTRCSRLVQGWVLKLVDICDDCFKASARRAAVWAHLPGF